MMTKFAGVAGSGFARRRQMAVVVLAYAVVLLAPRAARAQTPEWEVNVAPLYLWASELDGELSVNRATVPVFMSFGDAVDHLSSIFTFHIDGRRGRWGALADFGHVGLSTDAEVTIPGLLPSAPNRVVTAATDLGNTIFEAGVSYLVVPAREFSVVGGVRTYTMAPTIQFSAAVGQATPVDESSTAVNAFAGFLFRPKLSNRWSLVTRGDAGGGEGFTWSATAAAQFQISKIAGVMFGYHALGVHTGSVASRTQLAVDSGSRTLTYDMTHYGPILAFNLRWAH